MVQCTIRQKTVKTAKITIGVPIVACLPKLYQQCTNRQKQSKDSQTAKNDHWCTNRHMSTQSPPNTQSRANAATSRNLHHMCLGSGHSLSPACAGLILCVYMDVHASGSRSLPRAATLSSTYLSRLQLVNDCHQIFHIFGPHSQTFCCPARTP